MSFFNFIYLIIKKPPPAIIADGGPTIQKPSEIKTTSEPKKYLTSLT
jgi:hypothetical protein